MGVTAWARSSALRVRSRGEWLHSDVDARADRAHTGVRRQTLY